MVNEEHMVFDIKGDKFFNGYTINMDTKFEKPEDNMTAVFMDRVHDLS